MVNYPDWWRNDRSVKPKTSRWPLIKVSFLGMFDRIYECQASGRSRFLGLTLSISNVDDECLRSCICWCFRRANTGANSVFPGTWAVFLLRKQISSTSTRLRIRIPVFLRKDDAIFLKNRMVKIVLKSYSLWKIRDFRNWRTFWKVIPNIKKFMFHIHFWVISFSPSLRLSLC